MRARLLLATLAAAALAGAAAAQEPTPREPPLSGAVVSRASGERVRFVAEPGFRALALGQDLIGGDLVRTGPNGAVGVLFADRTVMRLHANTELLVNAVAGDAAELTLLKGAFWARAPRDAADLVVRTPSAAAAIRGTDWALAVEADGTTRLAVYDGAVELANPLGSVLAGAGEAAVAAPGAAPVKVVVANRREAEQMLFTLGPLELLDPLAAAAEEIAARAPANVPENAAALAGYRRGLALMRAGSWAPAAQAFAAAAPALGPERAAAARWLAAFARAAAGEPLAPPPPSEAGAETEALGAGLAAALRGDLDAAYAALAASDAPSALAAAVELAIARDDEAAAAVLVERLKAEAPGSVAALQAEAAYLGDVLGDGRAAAGRLERAVALAPEQAALWNDLGLARDALDQPVEAEAAFRRAMALSPAAPAPAGNLAILLLDQERVGEAEAVAGALLDADPAAWLGLRALGRAQVQRGEAAAGRETLLKALAAQPAVAEASLVLAIAAWQDGDRTRALQELDAAERLDPNDATVPLVRAVIALDEARAEEAIEAARRAAALLARQRRTGAFLPADRQSGSYLAQAFSAIGLDDWARATADLAYDPLSAASLFGEAFLERPAIGRSGPSASGGDAAIVQGLLLEPLAASARLRGVDLLRRPFLDAGLAGTRAFGDLEGWSGSADLQGFARLPTPLAFAANVSGARLDGPAEDGDTRDAGASLLLGVRPAPRLGAFAILGVNDDEGRDLDPAALLDLDDRDDAERESLSGGVGASWRLGGRRFLGGFASVSALDALDEARRFTLALEPLSFSRLDLDSESRSASQFLGLNYRGEDGAGVWIGGVEGLRVEQETEIEGVLTDLFTGLETPLASREEEERRLGRAYLDRRQRLAPGLEAEAALALNLSDEEDATLAPRAGLAWSFAEGQRLRVAALRDANAGLTTLAPISTLGLVPILAPLDPDGALRGGIVRWDGAFGDRLHLSVEHQSLRYDDLAYAAADPLDALDIPGAVLHATSARAELRLGGGVGLHAGAVHADSRVDGGAFDGEDLPETPEWTLRAGAAFLFPSRLSGALEAVWTSERFSGGEDPLDPALTLDAALGWETPDRRLAVGLRAENLLDTEIERPFGLDPLGRAVSLTASLRF